MVKYQNQSANFSLLPLKLQKKCSIHTSELRNIRHSVKFQSSVVMASFDVTSLFTNIPVNETIDILCNALFSNCQFFNGLDRSEFQTFLSLSVISSHFIFNGRLYQQVDGVAMGSPLDLLFANVFMSFYEQIWLQNCPSPFKPVLYRRYVDDCFLLFRS